MGDIASKNYFLLQKSTKIYMEYARNEIKKVANVKKETGKEKNGCSKSK